MSAATSSSADAADEELGRASRAFRERIESERERVDELAAETTQAVAAAEHATTEAALGRLDASGVAAAKAQIDVARTQHRLASEALARSERRWEDVGFRAQLDAADEDAAVAWGEPELSLESFGTRAMALLDAVREELSCVARRSSAAARLEQFCKQHGLRDCSPGRVQPRYREFAATFRRAVHDAGLAGYQCEEWLGLRWR